MANPKHVEILRQGVDVWNAWRARSDWRPPASLDDLPGPRRIRDIARHWESYRLSFSEVIPQSQEQPDLSGESLTNAVLPHIDFSWAILDRVDLSQAVLDHADLSAASLDGANLESAQLKHARLTKASLSNAVLKDADLSHAVLTEAFLNSSILEYAWLKSADMSKATLEGADLTDAFITDVNLSDADLAKADLTLSHVLRVNLQRANLTDAILHCEFQDVDLTEANLTGADLRGTSLTKVRLAGADLTHASLVETTLRRVDLRGARVYGISAWDVRLDQYTKRNQTGLIITPHRAAEITVDNLEVAQFVYLLLTNYKIRDVLDTIGKKGVLILGRFTDDRKVVLNALRDRLRAHNFVPMVFDFERATSRDFTETVKILAGLSRFVIADITKPRSVPQELEATVPDYEIPFVPIQQRGEQPYSMFTDLQKYPWMLPLLEYPDVDGLLGAIERGIVRRALEKSEELIRRKGERLSVVHAEDFRLSPDESGESNSGSPTRDEAPNRR